MLTVVLYSKTLVPLLCPPSPDTGKALSAERKLRVNKKHIRDITAFFIIHPLLFKWVFVIVLASNEQLKFVKIISKITVKVVLNFNYIQYFFICNMINNKSSGLLKQLIY
jgi:hypothetical protein